MYCAQETIIPALMQAGSGTLSTHTRSPIGLPPLTLPSPVVQTTSLLLPLKRTSAPPPGLHPLLTGITKVTSVPSVRLSGLLAIISHTDCQ